MPDSLFTLIAQVVNFLVIVVVLRLLLFKRIVQAIDQRQEDISTKHEDANRHESEAKTRAQDLKKKNAEFQQERDRRMKEARSEAEELKKELLEEARNDVDDKHNQWLSEIDRENARFIQDIRQTALGEVLNLTERMITDLAGDNLQEQMALKLISVIHEDEKLRDNLKGSEKVAVKSSFPLSDERQSDFKELLGDVEFLSAEGFHGIRVDMDGKRVEWTIESWLDSFEENFKTRLNEMMELVQQ